MITTNGTKKPNITIPEHVLEMSEEAGALLNSANKFTIGTDRQYEVASLDLKTIKNKIRAMDDQRKQMTRPVDEAKKQIMDFFRTPVGFLKDAECILKRSMLSYQDEKEREARKEQARLKKRQQEEQERLACEAEEIEKAGDSETANAIIEHAATIPETIIVETTPKVTGVRTSIRWSAELLNKTDVIKGVLDGSIPDIAIDINMKFFNQQAVSLKGAFNYSGVKVVSKKSIAA